MKENWKNKRIEQCFKVKSGDFLPANKMAKEGSVDVYGGNGIAGKHDQHNLTGENIIIGRVGAKCGNVKRVSGNIWVTDNAFYICEFIEEFDLRFLEYLLSTKNLRDTANQTAQPVISYKTIKNVILVIPPLSEQKRIVTILDEVFEGINRAIANTERNLANSRELFESYLNTIFKQKCDGWKEKTLQEISIKFSRGKSKHRPRGDKKLYGGKYPLIQTGDISNAKHRITSYSQTYNELGLAQSAIWPEGTVCIAIVGANVAETAILDFDACFPDSVIGIIVNNEVADSDYVEYLLQSFKAELKEKGKGTARDNINIGTFANQRFPFPNVKTQKIIAFQLEELSFETQRLEIIYQQKITALNELKQSILQKAFTGELTADTANQVRKTAKEEIAA
ncbi:restriction endonuclease subunit S [Nostoc sp.]|uniref:restriction endonuclease subunit S n=1 Tax=Nostoc sp. TaxID=1180 RepID=UPI002FF8A919